MKIEAHLARQHMCPFKPTHCAGPVCMAWRKETVMGHETLPGGVTVPVVVDTKRGYCGMVYRD